MLISGASAEDGREKLSRSGMSLSISAIMYLVGIVQVGSTRLQGRGRAKNKGQLRQAILEELSKRTRLK